MFSIYVLLQTYTTWPKVCLCLIIIPIFGSSTNSCNKVWYITIPFTRIKRPKPVQALQCPSSQRKVYKENLSWLDKFLEEELKGPTKSPGPKCSRKPSQKKRICHRSRFIQTNSILTSWFEMLYSRRTFGSDQVKSIMRCSHTFGYINYL